MERKTRTVELVDLLNHDVILSPGSLLDFDQVVWAGSLRTQVRLKGRFTRATVGLLPEPFTLEQPETWHGEVVDAGEVIVEDRVTYHHRTQTATIRLTPYPLDPCGCMGDLEGEQLLRPCKEHAPADEQEQPL